MIALWSFPLFRPVFFRAYCVPVSRASANVSSLVVHWGSPVESCSFLLDLKVIPAKFLCWLLPTKCISHLPLNFLASGSFHPTLEAYWTMMKSQNLASWPWSSSEDRLLCHCFPHMNVRAVIRRGYFCSTPSYILVSPLQASCGFSHSSIWLHPPTLPPCPHAPLPLLSPCCSSLMHDKLTRTLRSDPKLLDSFSLWCVSSFCLFLQRIVLLRGLWRQEAGSSSLCWRCTLLDRLRTLLHIEGCLLLKQVSFVLSTRSAHISLKYV